MVDLTAKPFHLDAAAVAWVRSTIDAMTLEEKIGQLFINLNVAFTPAYLDHILDTLPCGRDALPGCGRRDGAGAHPLRAVEVEDPAAHRLEPRDGRLRERRRRHAGLHPPAGRLAPRPVDRPRDGPRRRGRDRRARLQLGVRADRRHPPQLAQHGRRHPLVRQHARGRDRAREGVLRRHQRVEDRLRHQAFPRRRRGRARPARGHDLEHARRRRVARQLRPGLPRDDRPRRAVDHGRPHRRPRAVAQAPPRHRRRRHPAGHPGPRAAAGPAPRRARLQRPDPHRCLADGRPDLGHAAPRPGAGRDRRGLRHVPLLPRMPTRTSATCSTATATGSSPRRACRTRSNASWG